MVASNANMDATHQGPRPRRRVPDPRSTAWLPEFPGGGTADSTFPDRGSAHPPRGPTTRMGGSRSPTASKETPLRGTGPRVPVPRPGNRPRPCGIERTKAHDHNVLTTFPLSGLPCAAGRPWVNPPTRVTRKAHPRLASRRNPPVPPGGVRRPTTSGPVVLPGIRPFKSRGRPWTARRADPCVRGPIRSGPRPFRAFAPRPPSEARRPSPVPSPS